VCPSIVLVGGFLSHPPFASRQVSVIPAPFRDCWCAVSVRVREGF
jgi:hypothetical protein